MSRTEERPGAVTRRGAPVTLLGPEIREGDPAPDFRVVDESLRPVTLADTRGRVRVFSVVPSLDTHTCTLQSVWFERAAGSLPGVDLYTVSVDLPFAQKRWREENGAENLRMLSDYQDRSFGLSWGTLQKDLKLETRAVFVVDREDVVQYVEYVPETSKEPDYEKAFLSARRLAS